MHELKYRSSAFAPNAFKNRQKIIAAGLNRLDLPSPH